jgi:hypothetical protein
MYFFRIGSLGFEIAIVVACGSRGTVTGAVDHLEAVRPAAAGALVGGKLATGRRPSVS